MGSCSRFEMLAFKSDVSHWRSQKELVGVSVRYVRVHFSLPCIDRQTFCAQNSMSSAFGSSHTTSVNV